MKETRECLGSRKAICTSSKLKYPGKAAPVKPQKIEQGEIAAEKRSVARVLPLCAILWRAQASVHLKRRF